MLATTNGGQVWRRQSVPTSSQLTSVLFLNSLEGWASVDGGLIHTVSGGVTGVAHEVTVTYPDRAALEQNYPNPFNPLTTIRYGLPSRSHVTLTVFTTLGQQVATLVEGEREAGYHEARFDGSGFASRVYLYRLQAGEFVQTRKFVLLH